MKTILTGGTIVTPRETLSRQAIVLEEGVISSIQPVEHVDRTGAQVIDAAGQWITPGLIDIHVHGADGYDTMDATHEALHRMARYFASRGVTGYLPTTMTGPGDAIDAALENVRTFPQPADGAAHLGVHLEGPYLGSTYKGAQIGDHLRNPIIEEYTRWFDTGLARLMTVAPELDGVQSLIESGLENGVAFSLGHSGADYNCVMEAAGWGITQATHAFNGMKGLHHREPGTLGAVLAEDRIFAQIIADGVHVHPAMIKLLVRAKTPDRTIVITDAMRATGLSDGTYDLGGQEIQVIEGVARTASGSLAGSTLTMDRAVRNMVTFTGLPFSEAIAMASTVPARAIGLDQSKGKVAVGADADLTLWNSDLEVQMTIVGGKIVYKKS